MRAIQDFDKNARVTARKLPSEEKANEIEKELQSLPPLGRLRGNRDNGAQAAIAAHYRHPGDGYSFVFASPLPLVAAVSKPAKDEDEQ